MNCYIFCGNIYFVKVYFCLECNSFIFMGLDVGVCRYRSIFNLRNY